MCPAAGVSDKRIELKNEATSMLEKRSIFSKLDRFAFTEPK